MKAPAKPAVRSYRGVCNNKGCPRCGVTIDLGDGQPVKAPICEECGEELQVYAPKRRAA